MSETERTAPAPESATRQPITTRGLPTRCPEWCHNDHQQAIDEGCTVKEARVHISPDTAGLSRPLVGAEVRWNASLHQDPAARPVETLVLVSLHDRDDDVVLTPSAARSLARQLVHLADQAEL